MKNLLVTAVVVVVVVVGVAQGLPIQREPRQFVYQEGSPSVRLYPVHFDYYLKSSPGRVHLKKEASPVVQVFGPNLLQPKMEKTERPSIEAGPMTTPTTPQVKPVTTTTSTTTSTVTTSEPKRVSVVSMEPKEVVTTLQPLTMDEAEEEPVTEVKMMLEGDSSALPRDGEEPVSATEIMPVMEVEEVEAATELSHDKSEMTHSREGADDETVTELTPEDEVTTEIPNLRELLDIRTNVGHN